MPPTVNQEINVNINALVKRIQDVRELVQLIRSYRETRGSGPVLVDDRISKNAREGAKEIKQLQTSIDALTAAVHNLDDQNLGKFARVLQILASISNVLGHIKGSVEGVEFLLDLGQKFPDFTSRISTAGTALRDFFQLTRQKIGDGLTKAKQSVSDLFSKLPSLSGAGGAAAGSLSRIGVAGAAAAIGVGALVAVVGVLVVALTALAASVAIFGFLFKLAESAAAADSEIHDLSQELAVSAETLSAVKAAARTTSTSFEEAAGLVSKFNKLIGEAADGSKDAARDLKRLGVEPQEALKNNEAALAKVFKRIHDLPTPYEKARAAQIAFGKSGAAMVPVIDSVGGSLEKAKEKAKEFGQFLDDKASKQADEFGDQMDELKLRVEGFGLSIGRALIPELLKLLRIFSSEMPGAGGAFQTVINQIKLNIEILVNEVIVAIAALKTLAALPSALGVLIGTGSFEAAFGLIRDRFKQELTELLRIANTEPTGGGSTGTNFEFGKTTDEAKKAASTFEDLLNLRRTKAQSEFNLEKDLVDRLTSIYKTALDNRTIATEDYFRALEDLRRRELKAQIKLNEDLQKIEQDRRKEALKEIASDKDTTPTQKNALKLNVERKFDASIAQLHEQFLLLARAAGDLPREIEAGEEAALKVLDDQINAFLAKVDEVNGRTAAAAAAAIDAEFRELLEKITIEQGENSPLVKLIKEFIQVQKDRARVKQIDERLQPLGQKFDIERLGIETKISKEQITQKQGQRELIQLQRKYLENQLAILKNELANTKEARTQLEIKLRIAQIENQLANLKEVNETARQINESLKAGAEDFFASLLDRTKTLKEAISDLGRFILQMFARLAARRLVESLFGNLLGDSQGQGGLGGILSGVFGGKKAAGDMMSARPGGTLIQVAEAGYDELVVSTDPKYADRTAGLLGAFIRRTGIVPDLSNISARDYARSIANTFHIPRLAAGAFVPAAGPATALAGVTNSPTEPAPRPKVVIAVGQDEIANASMSSAGEKVWLYHFNNNRRALGFA